MWLPRFLPLLDLPAHLATISIFAHRNDPDWGFARFFEPSWLPIPYWLYWLPVRLLTGVFSVEVANKIFLSLYAAALPLSFAALATRLGRSPWLAVLALPFVFDHSFSHGFIACAAGVPLVLLTLAALLDLLAAPSLRRAILVLAGFVATFFMHFVPWLALVVLATVIVAFHARERRRALPAVAVLLVALAIAVGDWLFVRARHPMSGHLAWAYLPAAESVAVLFRSLLTPTSGPATAIVLALMGVSLVALLATARPDRALPLGLFAAAIALYFATPFKLMQPVYIWSLQPRLSVFVALFGVLCVPGAIAGGRRWLLAPALAAALAFPLVLLRAYRHFDARAHGFVAVLGHVPRGATVLTLMLGPVDEPLLARELEPWRGFPSYPAALNGGLPPYRWDLGFPDRTRPGTELPAPYAWEPWRFSQFVHGQYWDFVITDGEAHDGAAFPDAVPPLVAESGEWRLYRSRGVK